ASALTPAGPGLWTGRTSDAYWNFGGPFGGITAAVMLRAPLEAPDRLGEPVSLTVNYCAPVAKGAFTVSARATRTNRSTQHWYVELSQPEGGVAITATAVFATRRPTWSHFPAKPPDGGDPDSLPALPTGGMSAWLSRYRFRFVDNAPGGGGTAPASARSVVWMDDAPARPLDFPSIASLSDAFFARIFHVQRAFFPVATVSMTVYFHAAEEEIAAVGAAPLLGVADGRAFTRGISDQTGELWSRAGRLLATTHQIVYYRN
ncbi:MAG: thioesterase family protein, partial [Rhodospirillales bacterium]|nr:thioesterase family protein [Rhodospirillales bacterium]